MEEEAALRSHGLPHSPSASRSIWTCTKAYSGLHGDFWLHEGYDHVTRKGRFGYAVAYVLNNPVKAGLVKYWREHRWTYLNPNLPGFD